MIEEIRDETTFFALILRKDYDKDGVSFFTPNTFSQQLAFMRHPPDKRIPPHRHKHQVRKVETTQEVLFIRKGKLRVDFYRQDNNDYVKSVVLNAGDTILLIEGGHGFLALEPLEMIEVKQGPYDGALDKELLEPVPEEQIRIDSPPF